MKIQGSCFPGLMAFLLLNLSAAAAMPDPEQMRKDLETLYATSAVNSSLDKLTDEGRSLIPLMFQQGEYLMGLLHPWDEDPKALLLTDGNHGEHGIRPNTHTAFSFAAMVRCIDEPFPQSSREDYRAAALAILRFVLPTHSAGGLTCSDGKTWYGQWQSALWADGAGRAAWLLWDDLDPEMKWLSARMICDEADRFVGQRPPARIEGDTKAEENAWNSTVVSLAYNMFPNHPNHERYKETAIRWALSSFVRERDLRENPVIDGKTLKQWDVGATLHDDYTLENHDRVHPDYMNTITLLLLQIPVYAWGGNEPPEALFFNVPQVYANLKIFAFPDGNHIYPSGQDWRLHRNSDWMQVHLPMAILYDDPQAMTLFEFSLDATRRMIARNPALGLYHPGENFFPSTQMYTLEKGQVLPYLLNGQLGGGPKPEPEADLWKDLSGNHIFRAGKFAVYRTPVSISTFSWGQQVMGMAFPIQKDLLLNPFERSMIGVIEQESIKNERPVVGRLEVMPYENELAIAGVIERAEGKLEQRFAFVTLSDGRTLYVDRVSAVAALDTPTTLSLGTIPILNDHNWIYHDGDRTIHYAGGQLNIPARPQETKPVTFDSPWINLDGELGMVVLKRTGRSVLYPEPYPARARIQQLLHLNQSPWKEIKSGQLVAETAVAFYPARDSAATRRAAAKSSFSIEEGNEIILTLEDGRTVAVNFDALKVTLR